MHTRSHTHGRFLRRDYRQGRPLTLHVHLDHAVNGGRNVIEGNTLVDVAAVTADVVDNEHLSAHPNPCNSQQCINVSDAKGLNNGHFINFTSSRISLIVFFYF